jgi:hypothetical protein
MALGRVAEGVLGAVFCFLRTRFSGLDLRLPVLPFIGVDADDEGVSTV